MAGAPLFLLRAPGGTLPLLAVLVDRLEEAGELLPVPAAPPAIAGVTEVRSVVLTLLDPAALPGWEPGEPDAGSGPGLPRCVLRLTEPWRHLAIHVPAGSRLDGATGPHPGVLTPRRLAAFLADLVTPAGEPR